VVAVCILLIAATLGGAYLDGLLDELIARGSWRVLISPAVVVTYILAIAPVVKRAEDGVIAAFRTLIRLDDRDFDELVRDASRVNPYGEAAAAGLGAAFGIVLGYSWLAGSGAFWLKLAVIPSVSLMFGLLIWTIYSAVAGTRLMSVLSGQPLHFDIMDTTVFRPIGYHSLVIALVFIGGIVLGMIFGLALESILDWRNWVIYTLLALVPLLVFFLNLRPVHRVLAAAKKRDLEAVQAQIIAACRALEKRLETGESTGTFGADLAGLIAFEGRLQAANTWPYDTAMIRTLSFSVFFPAVAALAQFVFERVLK
jgi:hypothetical protein